MSLIRLKNFSVTDRTLQRQRNTHYLLHLIYVNKMISQVELARQSKLSPATVSNILQSFIEREYLIEVGREEQKVGRRAVLLTFNPAKLLTASIVIDVKKVEIAIIDFSGEVLDYASNDCDVCSPEEMIEILFNSWEKLLNEQQIPHEAIISAGVVMPGLVDMETGSLRTSVNLAWKDVNVRGLLSERFKMPCYVGHLGRATLLSEALHGHAYNYDNVVVVVIGSGIGAGVMIDGHLLLGAINAASEVGHTSLDINGPRCGCGLSGCWEIFCSEPAILKKIDQYVQDDETDTVLSVGSTLEDLENAFQANDSIAQRIVAETARYMAHGFVNVIWNFDPDLIVLSGSVPRYCPGLVEATRQHLRQLHTARDLTVPIKTSSLGQFVWVRAASSLAVTMYLEKLAY